MCCRGWLSNHNSGLRNSPLVYVTAEHLDWCVAGLTAGTCNHLLKCLLPLRAYGVMYGATHGCRCRAAHGCLHLVEPCHQPGCVCANPSHWWCTHMFPASALTWDELDSTVQANLCLGCFLILDVMSQGRNLWVPPKNTRHRRKGTCFLEEPIVWWVQNVF